MIIKNCQIIYKDRIENGSIRIKEGKIHKINPCDRQEHEKILDAKGLYLSPGFIDIHIHGAGGHDMMEGTKEAICHMAKAILKHGTTSFVPTTMTEDIKKINKAIQTVKKLKGQQTGGAQVLGVHLEGPFVSPEAIGAQNPAYLLKPNVVDYKEMVRGCEDAVLSITVAPELEGSKELITYITKQKVICAVGHTHGNYEEIIRASEWGVTHATHLYNAMTPFSHRAPGVVGAVFDNEMTAEIIADGIHVSYPALRIALKQKTTDKIILITDAMMACGMKDGEYALGGQKVNVCKGEARLENGDLAGSVLTLDQAVKNIYKNCQIPLYEAVKMATYNPAKLCKQEGKKGLIAEGYDADLILFNEDIEIQHVFVKGIELFN